jgi:SpoVK/Ycf46/Vps4 family AAA+-type ATPase
MTYDIVKPTAPTEHAPPAAGLEAILQLTRLAAKRRGVSGLLLGMGRAEATQAVEYFAQTTRSDVYRVDVGRILSKFMGETERNIDAVFADAERAGAQLFLDEADALFGGRTDVQDAHDRYANDAIDYLLQRIESFPGIVILATNRRFNIDAAVIKRFGVVVPPPAGSLP